MSQERQETVIAQDIIGLSFNRVLENYIPRAREEENKMACADQYFGCPGLREISKLSFSVKVLFSVFFFFCFKPIYFLTKFCGKKQNLNDSTYVTQNYWALSFFFKDNPHENSIFGLSRFPFQPELLG